MRKRTDLTEMFKEVLGNDHVYFQPPSSVRMLYPCIRYEFSGYTDIYADDIRYVTSKSYTVTIIYKDPDSNLPDLFREKFKNKCHFDRQHKADNLYHTVFTLNY